MNIQGQYFRATVNGWSNRRDVVEKPSGKVAMCIATCSSGERCGYCVDRINHVKRELKSRSITYKWVEMWGKLFVVLPAKPLGQRTEDYLAEVLNLPIVHYE